MTNLRGKAIAINDPGEMLRRIAKRNNRIITRIDRHQDAARFGKHLASRTRSDIKHLADLLKIELDES